jgi:hypothetical protein
MKSRRGVELSCIILLTDIQNRRIGYVTFCLRFRSSEMVGKSVHFRGLKCCTFGDQRTKILAGLESLEIKRNFMLD